MPDNAAIYAAKPQVISAGMAARDCARRRRCRQTKPVWRDQPVLGDERPLCPHHECHAGEGRSGAHGGLRGLRPEISQGRTPDEIAEFTARVRSVRQVLGCVIEPGWDAGDDCRRILDAVARESDAFLLLDGSVYVVATGEKWLLPALQQRETETALARKQRSEAILRLEGVPYIEHLPTIETEETMRRRTAEEIAWRAMAVGLAAVKGEGLEQPRVLKVLADYHLGAHLTLVERRFLLDENPSDLDRTNFTWKYECYWVLLWALGYGKALGRPDHLCDVPAAVRVMVDRTSRQFITEARRAGPVGAVRRRRPRLSLPLGRRGRPAETGPVPGGPRSGRRLRAALRPELAHRLCRRLGSRPDRHLIRE